MTEERDGAPMTSSTVAGIDLMELAAKAADRLTKAQQEALLRCDTRWLNSAEIGASGTTLRALCWLWPKGASPLSPPLCLLSRDYQDSPLRYIYRLTEVGVAVAAALRARASLIEEERS